MDKHTRTLAIYLGALLLDGIISPDLKVIKKTIDSLERASSHVAMLELFQGRKVPASEDVTPADVERPANIVDTDSRPSKQHARNETPRSASKTDDKNDNDPNPAS